MESLALCILLPGGRLCNTAGALSIPFSSSGGGVLSHSPLPAGNQQPSKLFEISDVHAAFSEVMASRVRVMGSIEILGGL